MTGPPIPNSDVDVTVLPVVQAGTWISIPITFEGTSSSYLSTNVTLSTLPNRVVPKVVFKPRFTQDGEYLVKLYTPGREEDGTCALRGTVNISGVVLDLSPPQAPLSTTLALTNRYGKFDQVYYGIINATTDYFQPWITVALADGQEDLTVNMVAQMARFEIITWDTRVNESSMFGSADPSTNSSRFAP